MIGEAVHTVCKATDIFPSMHAPQALLESSQASLL